MATAERMDSPGGDLNLPDIAWKKFAIIVSEWNDAVTGSLFEGAFNTLIQSGVKKEYIFRRDVPGSFELSLGAQLSASQDDIDAVICLGCVIRGETSHYEYICQSVAQGLKDVALKFNKPVIFGVLTTDNMQQALDRAGGKYGNKGEESAMAAIKMLRLIKESNKSKS
jgi:6,7-dimethyl-8-ribityllumazine synthase